MSPGHGTRWILAGLVAICLAFPLLPMRHDVAEGGDSPPVSRGGWLLSVRDDGANRERTSPGDDAFAWEKDLRMTQVGKVTPEKYERWRNMTPEERERYRERYRRWKKLSPKRRERILERRRRWHALPEKQRRFLKERREIYRNAWPEEKRAIEKFTRRWRDLPPERRHAMRRRLSEMRDLPASERDKRLMDWQFFRRLSPSEKKAVSRFLFSKPSSGPKNGPSRSPRD